MKYVLLSNKKWNSKLKEKLENRTKFEWIQITSIDDFNYSLLKDINPEKIFIPHWSYIIPEEIYNNFECIVFHMTDLPFGRGGSPLQNLIERKIYKTKISAIKVVEEIDAGPVYLKKDLDLLGSAEEIFLRANNVVEEMIIELINENLVPLKQSGEVVKFKRRTKMQSCINELNEISEIYDYIRMLDAEGYPKAYIEFNDIVFEFDRAHLKADHSVVANVRIFKK